ncbi:hypothetical protein EI94DRAFT_1830466 [Lactarius quietus]|nr:hypothetical protein EI94DRAFT_1830466 [Lactarius quietus]
MGPSERFLRWLKVAEGEGDMEKVEITEEVAAASDKKHQQCKSFDTVRFSGIPPEINPVDKIDAYIAAGDDAVLEFGDALKARSGVVRHPHVTLALRKQLRPVGALRLSVRAALAPAVLRAICARRL